MNIFNYLQPINYISKIRTKVRVNIFEQKNENDIVAEGYCDYYGFHAKAIVIHNDKIKVKVFYHKNGKKKSTSVEIGSPIKEYYSTIKPKNNLKDDFYTHIIKNGVLIAYQLYKK